MNLPTLVIIWLTFLKLKWAEQLSPFDTDIPMLCLDMEENALRNEQDKPYALE